MNIFIKFVALLVFTSTQAMIGNDSAAHNPDGYHLSASFRTDSSSVSKSKQHNATRTYSPSVSKSKQRNVTRTDSPSVSKSQLNNATSTIA